MKMHKKDNAPINWALALALIASLFYAPEIFKWVS